MRPKASKASLICRTEQKLNFIRETCQHHEVSNAIGTRYFVELTLQYHAGHNQQNRHAERNRTIPGHSKQLLWQAQYSVGGKSHSRWSQLVKTDYLC